MCRQVTCEKCGKPTWQGCGAHVEAVLGHVPKAERCVCRETADAKSGAPTSWWDRLMGSAGVTRHKRLRAVRRRACVQLGRRADGCDYPFAARSRAATSSFTIPVIAAKHPRRNRAVLVREEAREGRGDDLPGDAPAIAEPAALDLRAAVCGERAPEAVHLVLVGALDRD